MAKVLLAEDDPGIAEPLARALAREGYEVEVATTGQSAMDLANTGELLLLDLSMPDVDGVEVIRSIRKAGQAVPILVLTARADEVDKVLGAEVGADDYVTKPFRLADLMARVRSLINRGPNEALIPEDTTTKSTKAVKAAKKAAPADAE